MLKSKMNYTKQKKLIELFIEGTPARTASELAGVNRATATYYFHRLRKLIFSNSYNTIFENGKIKRIENALNNSQMKIENSLPVFGIVMSDKEINTIIFSEFQVPVWVLLAVLRDRIKALFYTTSHQSYNVFDLSTFKFICVDEMNNGVADYNNTIENFWNFTKKHLQQFNGVPVENFHLYIKECEWRYNNQDTVKQVEYLQRLSKIDCI